MTSLTKRPKIEAVYDGEVELAGHQGTVLSARFNPAADKVVSGGLDRAILLWDLAALADRDDINYGVITGHKGAVVSVEWAQDDTRLVSASADSTVGLWDAASGTRLRKWTHRDCVNQVVPVGSQVASVSDDGTCQLWDAREKQSVARVTTEWPLIALATRSDDTLIMGGVGRSVVAYDVRNLSAELWACTTTDTVTGLSVNRDASMAVAREVDGTARIVNVLPKVPVGRLGRTVYRGTTPKSQWGCRAAFSPTSVDVVTAGEGATVFDLASSRVSRRLFDDRLVVDVTCSTDWVMGATDKGLFMTRW
ncbi:hypothetical protein DICA0_E04258 [Diutina catenulata]